jgi:hypothetical protein
MKIMKDKIADVVQGITGIYLLILFVFNLIGLPLQMGPVGMQVYDMLTWTVALILGVIIIGLKENNGIDLFGMILVIMNFIGLMVSFLPIEIRGTFEFFAGIGMLITAVGLLLEAFDVIKPLKMK